MPLTQQQIDAMSSATGLSYSSTPANVPSLADKIRAAVPVEKSVPIVEAGKRTIDTFNKIGGDVSKAFADTPTRALEAAQNPDGSVNPLKAIPAVVGSAGVTLGKTGKAIAEGTGALIAMPFDAVLTSIAQEKPDLVNKIKSSEGYKDISNIKLTPEAQQAFDKAVALTNKFPDVTDSIVGLVQTLMLGGASSAEKQIIKEGTVLKNTVQDMIPATTPKSPAPVAFEDSITQAKKILNPTEKYTPTEIERMRQRGEIKTEGKGILKKDVANPNTTLQDETVAELVQQGKISTKNTPSQNIGVIKQEARINDANIDEIVNRPDLNKPFTKSTLNKVFNSVTDSAKKDLVFVSDTTEEKIYNAVLGVAKEEINNNPLNSAGLRKSIKAFNARMEEILGKDIYAGASESVGNARLQASKDVRKALNDFLADNLESPTVKIDKNLANKKIVNTMPTRAEYNTGKIQGGSVYRDQLQREARLLNAADEIAYRTRGTLGKTEIKQWFDAHPNVKKAVKYGAGAVGAKIGLDMITGD